MSYFPEIKTMADVPRFHGRERPDTTALVFGEEHTDYRTFDRHCSQVANGLNKSGIGKGDRIAWVGKNSAAYFEVLFGGAKAGAVMVPISWRLAPMEIDYILKDGDIKAVFVDEEFRSLVARAPSAASIKIIGLEGGAEFTSWRDAQSDVDPMTPVKGEDVFIQLYTSGTTGHPKGVQLPHGNFFVIERQRAAAGFPDQELFEWNTWGPEDVGIITMPCFHISGTGWGVVGLYAGAKNVVLREFTPEGVLRGLNDHRGTKIILVPTAIQMLMDHPDCAKADFSALNYLCYGASPIPLEILKRAVQMFQCQFVQMYGLTETTGAVTFLPAHDHEIGGNERMRSAGRAVYGVELNILDSEGKPVAPGTIGEICVRTPTIMAGYWGMPDETAKTIDADGWFHTGDAGYLDEDGYVFIKDRIKDMIVSGGVNIYPAEIENALYAHEDIAEAAVIGVPDSKWGESVKAFVVLKPGTDASAEQITAFCRDRIAGYKIPRSVEFMQQLPRNASGKVLKTELRKPFWEGQERQVG
ncbi:MAG: fatty acid--CoA ligase [Hyphomonadaceae bacterium]